MKEAFGYGKSHNLHTYNIEQIRVYFSAYRITVTYQPMPATEANSLLDDAMRSDQNRSCPVIPRYNHLGVAGQYRNLLIEISLCSLCSFSLSQINQEGTSRRSHGCWHVAPPPSSSWLFIVAPSSFFIMFIFYRKGDGAEDEHDWLVQLQR